jgi:hypothetical protein
MGHPPPAVEITTATIAFWGAIFGAVIALVGGLVGGALTNYVAMLRNAQDKESEWRSHAIELTKLDAERMIELRRTDSTRKLQPLVLAFLANYRDLQDLNTMSPKDLYLKIKRDRIIEKEPPPKEGATPPPDDVEGSG